MWVFISWLYGPVVYAQVLGPETQIQCYTLSPNAPAQNATGTGALTIGQRLVVGNSSCMQFPEYAPGFQVEHDLPEMPIKTVRIMFHVFQDDNGNDNWQSPAQDGGADEVLLRGLVNGLPRWPISTGTPSRTIRGLNGIYGQLDERLVSTMTNLAVVPAAAPRADTRIRFQLEGIRYYRNSAYWNLTDNNPWGCGSNPDPSVNNDACRKGFYTTFITNSSTSQDASGTALTASQKTDILHIFLGEHPGIASTRLDQYGQMGTRYGTGGVASGVPGAYMYCRGLYWDIKQHPAWSLSEAGFRYATWVLAHELGHCLGLWHVDGSDDCNAFTDPPAPAPWFPIM
ncbi:hypothetical protein [Hymenobacter negativus]|uniref:Matrixin family metalloprotease n=1 Tax=Hymenobacter negativus TaxID=2795026 RepID=A0ABS3QJ96_9BACT|nr:hypothetical protein [Hymenobacter negativus]MBO2010780.1 hypothetical protein [Hymenobacter negativus]